MKIKFALLYFMRFVFIIIGFAIFIFSLYTVINRNLTFISYIGINERHIDIIIIAFGIILTLINFLLSELCSWLLSVEENQNHIIELLSTQNHLLAEQSSVIPQNKNNKIDKL